MVDTPQNTSSTSPTATDIAKALAEQFVTVEAITKLWTGGEIQVVKMAKILVGILMGVAGQMGATLADILVSGEEIADPAFQRMMHVAFRDITGINMQGAAVVPGERDQRTAAARSLGGALLSTIAGTGAGGSGGGAMEPSQKGAEDYLTWVTQMALEGWLTGTLGEFVTLGQVEALGDLDDALATTLGLGRMSRRVMQPLLDAKVIEPFRWHTNRTYRPKLLAYTEVARQVARGRWTRERGVEELARQGFSDERIEAMFNAVAKFHSVADADLLVRAGEWSQADAEQHLRDQGYSQETAPRELALERLKRIASFERSMANAAVRAFVRRDINESQLRSAATGVTLKGQELAQLVELAITEREFSIKRLSLGQVEAMVKSGVMNVRDYARAAERDGYPPEDVLALELQLRWELDKASDIAQLRAQQQEERAAEAARRAAELAAKKAAIEADQALKRRGAPATIERAVVRGIAPIERYAELLETRYDDDTVAIMVDLVLDERARYVAEQARRDEALRRAEATGISLGDVEQAVLAKVVTLDDYRRRLVAEQLPAGDVELLVATLEARLRDRDEAERRRLEAGKAAVTRGVNLGTFEQLVRRGRRTLGQYEGLLGDLGFDAGAIAAMRELLELRIADDEQARAERAAAEARLRTKGLSLELLRRGVLLGVRTPEDFERFLRDQGFTTDAQVILMAELRSDLEEADAARRQREDASSRSGARELPLSIVARAARLGVVSPDAYEQRLFALGFDEGDVDIQLQLLLLEIADVQAQRQQRDAVFADAAGRGLSLAQVEQAVKIGAASIDDYRAALAGAGYAPAAMDTLLAVLAAELAQLEDARRRRDAIGGEGTARALSLGQLEQAVKAGERTLDDYYAGAQALGYALADAELLTMLVLHELNAKAAKG